MKAIVVYESLWGNTAAVARGIAEGLGSGAQALSTAQATPDVLAGADLVVAGAPVHALSLPSDQTRESARKMRLGPDKAPPDLSHPPLRAWLAGLAPAQGRFAAFETCVKAWYGRGARDKIEKSLARVGYQRLAPSRQFYVDGAPLIPKGDFFLLEGEVDRARQWGAELGRLMQP
jgi:hypothetical protein